MHHEKKPLLKPVYCNIIKRQNIGSGIDSVPRSVFALSAVTQNIVWATSISLSSNKAFEFTKTTDGGVSWEPGLLPDTIGNYVPISIKAIDAQTAWVLMVAQPNQNRVRLFKTTTGGLSWTEQTGGFNGIGKAVAVMHFFNANEGVMFGSPGTGQSSIDTFRIFRTNNGGDIWTRIGGANMPQLVGSEGIWIYGNNSYESYGDTLWCVTRKDRVFKTTDKGISWQAYGTGLTGTDGGLASIAFQNPMQGIVTSTNNKAARTTDGGLTWTPLNIPTATPSSDIEFVPGTAGTYVASEGLLSFGSQSVFMITKDGGDTWDTVTYSPAFTSVHFLSPTVAYAGSVINSATDGGIYKWVGDLSDSVASDITYITPETSFDVSPNPAATQIVVSTHELSNKRVISITNFLGETVRETQATDWQTVVEVADLPKGIYMISITDNNKVKTKKVILY
jgi:photosystem II stability/assembly factor-like uncharacterized protein